MVALNGQNQSRQGQGLQESQRPEAASELRGQGDALQLDTSVSGGSSRGFAQQVGAWIAMNATSGLISVGRYLSTGTKDPVQAFAEGFLGTQGRAARKQDNTAGLANSTSNDSPQQSADLKSSTETNEQPNAARKEDEKQPGTTANSKKDQDS